MHCSESCGKDGSMSAALDSSGKPLTKNDHLLKWVAEMAALTKPERIVWCDGSEAEKTRLTDEAVAQKILEPLNQEKLPGCYLHRSNPNDVARVEQLTFICTPTKDEAGPTNNWMEPERGLRQARQALRRLDEGPHDVRRPVHHGAGRLADVEGRRRAHRQHLRRPQHAHHDAHGSHRARHARRHERLQPRPALDARLQPRAPLHLPLPAGQHDLVRRLRLRRQRPARQEVPGAPHRQLPRQEGGLARRAHAHPRRREPRGRDDLRRGGLPQRLRQDELRDDDPAQALQGLEDLDRRRRHRLDARRR